MTLLFMLLFLALALSFLVGGLFGAPWVPARAIDLEKALDDVRLKRGEVFIELGCGDGRLLAAAAKRGARCIGYEINPLLCFAAYLKTFRYRSRVKIKLGNFWTANLASADVVAVFLIPKYMERLEQKLNKELHKGDRLISYVFLLPIAKPIKKSGRWYIYEYK